MRAWPFRGRDAELQLIRQAMRSGGGVVLAGSPGVGKTRLAREAVTGADQRRYRTLWATATAAAATVPLGALAPLLGETAPADDPLNMLRAAADTLLAEAGGRSLVLAIDDAHLLDEISANLVQHLVQTGKAFVLTTLLRRHAAPDPIRALWKNGWARRIEITPMTWAATADLLATALGGQVDSATTHRLWRTAQGDLLLLTELVRSGVEGGTLCQIDGVWRWEGSWVMSPRLTGALGARIGALTPAEREVLEVVAFSEPIGADLLTSLTDPEAVVAVEARNLLAVHQQGRRVHVRLAQPLYGELLRASCPAERATEVRRSLADAVEEAGARREDDAMRLATWRLDMAAPVKPDILVTGARQALAAGDLALAERLARAALESGEGPAAASVLWRVLLFAERGGEADQILREWAEVPMPDSAAADLAVGAACVLFFALRRTEPAYAVLRRARQRVSELGPRADLTLLEIAFDLLRGRVTEAYRQLTELTARPLPHEHAHATALVALGIAQLHRGRLREAQRHLTDGAALLGDPRRSDLWASAMCELYRCYPALLAGRLTEAGAAAAEFHDHAVRSGLELAQRLSCAVQAQVARLRGRVAKAGQWAREGLRLQRHRPDSAFREVLLGEVARAAAQAGDAETAVAALAEADRSPADAERLLRPWTELARPWVAAATGARQHAAQLALDAPRAFADQDAPCFEAFALHDAVRLGARAGEVADRLRVLADRVDSELVGMFAAHAAGAAAADPVALEASGASFAGAGADLLAAEAYVQAARAYREAGRSASDRRLRAQAALLLDGCEGARTPLVASIESPRLTARERDVARLAAAGMANRDIAERLVISDRTVGNHLHHIYAKLGIRGRSALADLLPPLHHDT